MKTPEYDTRNAAEILREIKRLSAYYTPEWYLDPQAPDVGTVMAQLFAEMLEGTLICGSQRLYHHYLYFLNLLGTKQLPPVAAEGMVTVMAQENAGGSFLPRGTVLYAPSDVTEGRMYYETTEALYVSHTQIEKIYQTDRASDYIACLYTRQTGQQKIENLSIFQKKENAECHAIYFGNNTVFETQDTADLMLQFIHAQSENEQEKLSHLFAYQAEWQYWNGQDWSTISDVSVYRNGVRLRFLGKIQPVLLQDNLSRYLRCTFAHIPDQPILLTEVRCGAQALHKAPDYLLFNTTQLSLTCFFPFQEQFAAYTDFYIASRETFTKKGAWIEIEMELDFRRISPDVKPVLPPKQYKHLMHKTDFLAPQPMDITIEKVAWEYWNGTGWARLFPGEEFAHFFSPEGKQEDVRTLAFQCPLDMQLLVFGQGESYYIRARLMRIQNALTIQGEYLSPCVHRISICYRYTEPLCVLDGLHIQNHLEWRTLQFPISGIEPLLQDMLCTYPALYLKLRDPIGQGPTRLFFEIEEAKRGCFPALQWEYYRKTIDGRMEWHGIAVTDGTQNFAHSGEVTLTACDGFAKQKLFGQTGYFIRIINRDCQYTGMAHKKFHPVWKAVDINTVKVKQRALCPPERFPIEIQQASKVCQLPTGNLESVEVWINEFGHITVQERVTLVAPQREERDANGTLFALWVKWEEVSCLELATAKQRVYEVEYSGGTVRFGDGRNGAIPPAQPQASIEIFYYVSAGWQGNLPAGKIAGFLSAMPAVAKVENRKPIVGGSNLETVEVAAHRMGAELSGMGRMVTLDDFERQICCCDQGICRVKCRAHYNEQCEAQTGTLSIAVLPREYMQGYERFHTLEKRIRAFIMVRSPVSLKHIQIFEVKYIRIAVKVELVVADYENYQEQYQTINQKLQTFLDPVCGGYIGSGWEIGSFPTKEQVYQYVKSVSGIRWIKSICIFAQDGEARQDVDLESLKQRSISVPIVGENQILITVENPMGGDIVC